MTAAQQARTTARRAVHSKPLEWLTRAGFVGYGLLHILVAWIAVQIVRGQGGREGDQSGAFRTLAHQPGGGVLLVAVAVGLFAMAFWQLLTAAVGHLDKRGKRRVAERIASLGRVVVYTALGLGAAKVARGAEQSAAHSQQSITAGFLGTPHGRMLIIVAGVVVAAVGIGLAIYGVTRAFERNLRLAVMNEEMRAATRWLGGFGYAAKGSAYAIVGILLIVAAVTYDASKSRGLDAALHTLARQPFGGVLVAIVALGFAAFGVYCFAQARYRKV
ncbi:MAG TPA: DUF1206 domain-containing protein [Micromonosporaceae bacterium]